MPEDYERELLEAIQKESYGPKAQNQDNYVNQVPPPVLPRSAAEHFKPFRDD